MGWTNREHRLAQRQNKQGEKQQLQEKYRREVDSSKWTRARLGAALDEQQKTGKHQPLRLFSYEIRDQQQRQGDQSEQCGGIEKLHELT